MMSGDPPHAFTGEIADTLHFSHDEHAGIDGNMHSALK
jgi:hypothetical protein